MEMLWSPSMPLRTLDPRLTCPTAEHREHQSLKKSISSKPRSTIRTRNLEVIVEADEIQIRLDKTQRLATQPTKAHNRWHPAIRPVFKIDPADDEVVLDTLDALDCQIGPRHGVAEAAEWDLNATHQLTGPVWINGGGI